MLGGVENMLVKDPPGVVAYFISREVLPELPAVFMNMKASIRVAFVNMNSMPSMPTNGVDRTP